MGNNIPILWFCRTVDELKAILETEDLSVEERAEIEELIKEKENEEK